jgi:plasmid stability protein
MRQLLLRVPDDVHRRLAARAEREGRSVNSVANEILDAAIDADQGDPRSRLRAKAQAAGVLREVPAQRIDDARRRGALDAMRGIGPVLDDLPNEERDRL